MVLNKLEKEIQDALGTTPYLLNNPSKETMGRLIDLIMKHSKCPDKIGTGPNYGLTGLIVGGLLVATTKSDIDQIIKHVSRFCREDSEMNWEGLSKDLRVFFKDKLE